MKKIRKLFSKLNRKQRFILFGGIILILAPIVINTLLSQEQAKAAWYNEAWSYRKQIVIDNTKVSGENPLANFPVLISRTDEDLKEKAQTDGDDILFTNAAGVKLDHEIETYTSATGQLIAWVRIPSLSATVDTTIYMYYGNPQAINQENVVGVWDSNSMGVWHLKEDPAGSAPQMADSTRNDNHGTSGGSMTDTDQVAAKINGGLDFDAVDDIIDAGSDASLDNLSSFTLSAWIYPRSHGETGNRGRIIDKAFELDTSTGWSLFMLSTREVEFNAGFSTTTLVRRSTGDPITLNAWNHVAVTWTGSTTATTAIVYINGSTVSYQTSTNGSGTRALDADYSLHIGNDSSTARTFDGIIDEARVADTVRTQAWIATEYNNQSDPSSFFSSVGDEEGVRRPILHFKFDEASGDTAYDTSGNGQTAAISGASWTTSDLCWTGSCLFFDGSDDVVTVTNSQKIDLNADLASSFTIGAWIRANSDGENDVGQIFSKGANTYLRVTNHGEDEKADLEASLDLATTDATVKIVNGITLNQWHYVAMTYSDDSDDEITIYIDGKVASSSTDGSGAPAAESNDLLIGGATTANFHGFIDEFKIYNYERTASEIKLDAIRGAGSNGAGAVFGQKNTNFLSNGLVGYWKLDSFSGDPSDSSGNGNTLTNNGTTTFVAGKFGNGSEHVPASSQHFSAAIASTNTYYFDASDAGPTDPDNVWENDANAFDGSTGTNAVTTTSGSSSSNFLLGEGTNASAGAKIISVVARLKACAYSSSESGIANEPIFGDIYTNGQAQLLGKTQGNTFPAGCPSVFGGTIDLDTPTGGWNWETLQSLEVKIFGQNNNPQDDFLATAYRAEIEVTSNENNPSLQYLKTISFWVNPDDLTNYYMNLNSEVNLQSNSSGVLSANGISNPKIYINGVPSNQLTVDTWQLVTVTSDTEITPTTLYVGRVGDNYFDGTLDEVRLYNRVLSPAEIQDLYNWAPPPIAYYNFDEGTGDTVNNRSGSGPTGTTYNSPLWTRGKVGGALSFDNTEGAVSASNDYVDFGDTTLYDGLSAISVSAWVYIDTKPTTSNYSSVIRKEGSFTPIQFGGPDSAGPGINVALWTSGLNGVNPNDYTAWNEDTWYHIAVTWQSGDYVKIYRNGTLYYTSTTTFSGTIANSANVMRMGATEAATPAEAFDGAIDDVYIYHYPRTPSQIIEDMNAGHPAPGSPVGSPVGHWKFDEGFGDTAYNSGSGGSGLNANLAAATTCPQNADSACPSWTNDGKVGKALVFSTDGATDDYARVLSDASLQITGDVTVSLWVNFVETGTVTEMFSHAASGETLDTNSLYELIREANNTLRFRWEYGAGSDEEVYSTPLTSGASEWVHIAVTRDTTNKIVRFYENGNLLSTASYTNQPAGGNTGRLYIGSDANLSTFLNGTLDELKIHASLLTDSQVKVEYNFGKAVVWGATSTASDGITSDFSASRTYCIPGDTSACTPPVLDLPMNENTGTGSDVVKDISGNENHADFDAGMTEANWVRGKSGSGVYFNGSSDYLLVLDDNTLDFSTGNFTWSLWVKTTQSCVGNKVYMGRYQSGNVSPWIGCRDSSGAGKAYASFRDSNGVEVASGDSTTTINDGKWHYLVAKKEGTSSATVKIYVDGVLENTGSGNLSGSFSSATNYVIGGNYATSGYWLDGVLDSIRMYNYARTPAQIYWEYNRGNPLAHYKFDECSGITAYNSALTANDEPKGLNGTITPGASGNTSAGSCTSGVSTDMWYNGATGKRNSSLDFDGINDYVSVGDIDAIDGVSQLTFSAWVKLDSLSDWKSIMSKAAAGSNNTWMGSSGDGNGGNNDVGIDIQSGSNTGAYTTGNIITTGVWNHWTMVYDGTQTGNANRLKFYLNGIPQNLTFKAGDIPAATASTTNPFRIGSGNSFGNNAPDGKIDEVRIYPYALTAVQIKTLVKEGAVYFGP